MNAPPQLDTKLFFYLPEVAEMLRCSVKTVRRLIESGKLLAAKHGGRVIVFRNSVDAYVGAMVERGMRTA